MGEQDGVTTCSSFVQILLWRSGFAHCPRRRSPRRVRSRQQNFAGSEAMASDDTDLQNDLLADIGWEEGSGSGEPGSGSGEPSSGEPSPQPEDLSFLYYTVPIVAVLLAVCACLCIYLRRRAARRSQITRLWQQHIQDASSQEPFLEVSKGGSVNSPAMRVS
jgi:hypothetical protein